MPHLTALTSTKPPLFCTFWFYLIPKWVFRYLLQTFIWFCLVNTPVTRVAVDVALFWEWLLSVSFLFKNLYWLSTSNFSVNKNMTVESVKMFIWFIASFIARCFNWVVKLCHLSHFWASVYWYVRMFDEIKFLKDHQQISFLILSEVTRNNDPWFSGNFRGSKNLSTIPNNVSFYIDTTKYSVGALLNIIHKLLRHAVFNESS